MKNPYTILNIPQDATNEQIVRSQFDAMKKREYSNKEIAEAKSILSRPETRLAIDFSFSVFNEITILPMLSVKIKSKPIEKFDDNKYNSLK